MAINKTLQKKLQKLSNDQLLRVAQGYKFENMVNSSSRFQKNYDTVILELKKRKLWGGK